MKRVAGTPIMNIMPNVRRFIVPAEELGIRRAASLGVAPEDLRSFLAGFLQQLDVEGSDIVNNRIAITSWN